MVGDGWAAEPGAEIWDLCRIRSARSRRPIGIRFGGARTIFGRDLWLQH